MSVKEEKATPYNEGARLSVDGALCTVRYVGPVEGTSGQWLGVEWDDPSRGKHPGEHKGVRLQPSSYVGVGKNKHPTAGSFVRPGRKFDRSLSLLEAAHEKYVSDLHTSKETGAVGGGHPPPIEFGGKVVEEVGFEKIRKLLAQLEELRIVLLDGMNLQGVLPDRTGTAAEREAELEKIRKTCPKITQLDLSRNLLQDWAEVTDLCQQLDELKILRLNGNRFHNVDETRTLSGITELSLNETLLSWDEIVTIVDHLPSLTTLSASFNQLSSLSRPLGETIKNLSLENNEFEFLSSLRQLTSLPNLSKLSLRGNKLYRVYAASDDNTDGDQNETSLFFSPSLAHLDISQNDINSWSFVNALPQIFPGLLSLRISGNPLYNQAPAPSAVMNVPEEAMTVDEAFMLTLARLSPLKLLNYSTITLQERLNGELYYLGLVRTELSIYPPGAAQRILQAHPRYRELCETYEVEDIKRKGNSDDDSTENPRSLGARLVTFTFYLRSSLTDSPPLDQSNAPAKEFNKEIPRSYDVYRIKSIVSRHFSLPPLQFRLIWETDEWDPVEQGTAEEDEWDSDEESGEEAISTTKHVENDQSGKKFVRREEELLDSTKEIGFLFDDDTRAVKVRVEVF